MSMFVGIFHLVYSCLLQRKLKQLNLKATSISRVKNMIKPLNATQKLLASVQRETRLILQHITKTEQQLMSNR